MKRSGDRFPFLRPRNTAPRAVGTSVSANSAYARGICVPRKTISAEEILPGPMRIGHNSSVTTRNGVSPPPWHGSRKDRDLRPAGGENAERTEAERHRGRKRVFMPNTHIYPTVLNSRKSGDSRRCIVQSALFSALCLPASVPSAVTPAAATSEPWLRERRVRIVVPPGLSPKFRFHSSTAITVPETSTALHLLGPIPISRSEMGKLLRTNRQGSAPVVSQRTMRANPLG